MIKNPRKIRNTFTLNVTDDAIVQWLAQYHELSESAIVRHALNLMDRSGNHLDNQQGLQVFKKNTYYKVVERNSQEHQNTGMQPKPDTVTSKKAKKKPSAELMAVEVSRDVFANRIKYDLLDRQYWQLNDSGFWEKTVPEFVFGQVRDYIHKSVPVFLPYYVQNVMRFAKKDYAIAGSHDLPKAPQQSAPSPN